MGNERTHPAHKLKHMQAVGVAVTKHINLIEVDADTGVNAPEPMLGKLAEVLGVGTDDRS